jgi:hypothetical protein
VSEVKYDLSILCIDAYILELLAILLKVRG